MSQGFRDKELCHIQLPAGIHKQGWQTRHKSGRRQMSFPTMNSSTEFVTGGLPDFKELAVSDVFSTADKDTTLC